MRYILVLITFSLINGESLKTPNFLNRILVEFYLYPIDIVEKINVDSIVPSEITSFKVFKKNSDTNNYMTINNYYFDDTTKTNLFLPLLIRSLTGDSVQYFEEKNIDSIQLLKVVVRKSRGSNIIYVLSAGCDFPIRDWEKITEFHKELYDKKKVDVFYCNCEGEINWESKN